MEKDDKRIFWGYNQAEPTRHRLILGPIWPRSVHYRANFLYFYFYFNKKLFNRLVCIQQPPSNHLNRV